MAVILWSSLGNTTVRESQHHMAERDPKVPPQEILDTNSIPCVMLWPMLIRRLCSGCGVPGPVGQPIPHWSCFPSCVELLSANVGFLPLILPHSLNCHPERLPLLVSPQISGDLKTMAMDSEASLLTA